MTDKTPAFINVDELMPQVSVEQVAAYYGVVTGELQRISSEIRTRCFLNCGRDTETGDRALAIDADHPAKKWRCHQYGCGRGGNLVSLCDLLKPGSHMDGKPRGQRFKEIAADLLAMTAAVAHPAGTATVNAPQAQPAATDPPHVNRPLAESEKEATRALVALDEKFAMDIAAMNPAASAYIRKRPFLTPDLMRKWRCGYLPHDAGSLLRGKFVYCYDNEAGEPIAWFGRSLAFEEQHQQWIAGGRTGREPPAKFQFPKNFHRGLNVYGAQVRRLQEPGYREALQELGLIIVEGPNDVIALDALGVPAVGLCSNSITAEQVEKLARWSRQLAGGRVTLLLDNDPEGERGAKDMAYRLAQHCAVRVAWSSETHGGRFRSRQPESLSFEEWEVIRSSLR